MPWESSARQVLLAVMAGLVPAIHVFGPRESKTWMPGTRPGMTEEISSPLLAAVDLAAHQRDRFLIDACGISGLDGGEIRLARLVARARAPAMRFQEIGGR